MRKQLTVGTALAAAAMLAAGGALAADKKMMKPSITVGGFFNQEIGGILDTTQERTRVTTVGTASGDPLVFTPTPQDLNANPPVVNPTTAKSNQETETSSLDSRTDAEVHFTGNATLDNGVKIMARIELEGDTAGDQLDETFITISGSFGQITLGGDDNAPDKLLLGYSGSWATNVGSNPFLRGVSWVPDASGLDRYSGLGVDDSNKITYISPSLGGFSVGISYTPADGTEDSNANPDISAGFHDGISGGIAYGGNFGDVSIGGGVGYRTAQAADGSGDKDDRAWAIAGRLGFGPVTLAAAYKKTVDPMAVRQDLVDLGVRFVQGANSFSLSGVHAKADEGDARLSIAIASYARSMGPGVTWHTDLIWNQSKSGVMTSNNFDPGTAVPNADGTDTEVDGRVPWTENYADQHENSGMAFVTGIKVAF